MVQQDVHSCEQFRGAERLRDIVVRPRFERRDSLRLERPSGQHDDGQARPGSYVLYHLNTISIGQAQIDDGEVGSM